MLRLILIDGRIVYQMVFVIGVSRKLHLMLYVRHLKLICHERRGRWCVLPFSLIIVIENKVLSRLAWEYWKEMEFIFQMRSHVVYPAPLNGTFVDCIDILIFVYKTRKILWLYAGVIGLSISSNRIFEELIDSGPANSCWWSQYEVNTEKKLYLYISNIIHLVRLLRF